MKPTWPTVAAGVLALAPTLPEFAGFAVYDGQPISGEQSGDYLCVGFVVDDTSGSFRQAPDPSGMATQEAGEVKCHLVSATGDTDPSYARNRAFAAAGALQAGLYADNTLGGLLGDDTTLSLAVDVVGVQNAEGSAQSLLLTVTYWTNTYV